MTALHVPPGLAPLLERSWLLVGVGNDMRGDDAFGPLLARALRDRGLPALDAGMAPENVTGPIRRSGAEVLILADAAAFGAPEGTVRLLGQDDLLEGGTSTHDPSLRLLFDFLAAEQDFAIHALVAQAGSRALGNAPGTGISAAVAALARAFEGPLR